MLYNDIKKLDITPHRFSLIIIRNTFEEYPNKILLKYDERWEGWMLPYYKTPDVENGLLQQLTNDFKTPLVSTDIDLKVHEQYEKYSVSDKVNKLYDHYFYNVTLPTFKTEYKQSSFLIEHRRYRWFTLDEMRSNKRIMEINDDVVSILSKIAY